MKAMGFTVYAAGRSVYDSLNRQRVIAIDEPVKIDGVTFRSGDLVIADQDGVVARSTRDRGASRQQRMEKSTR